MWIMILLLPMAYLIGACIGVLPPKYRRVPNGIGWALLIPCLIGLIIPAYSAILHSPLAPLNLIMVLLATLTLYYVIRAAAFMGIVISYKQFSNERYLRLPVSGMTLGWVLSVIEPLWMATLFALSYFMGYPGKMDVRGMAEVLIFVSMTLTLGIALSYFFLIVMYSIRKQVKDPAKFAARASERVPSAAPARTSEWKKPNTIDPRGSAPKK